MASFNNTWLSESAKTLQAKASQTGANKVLEVQTDALVVHGNGNVGIGTDSPDSPLTVKEVSNTAINVLKSNGSSLLKIGEDGGGNAVYNATLGGAHIFQDNGTEAMRIDSSGALIHKAAAVFNEDSNDADFRVESDSVSNMLQVDAASNGVGIRVDGNAKQSLRIKSISSTANMTLMEDEDINGAYTPYYQYKVAYIAGNSSNTQLTIPFKNRSYNQTGYLKIRVLPAIHNQTVTNRVATAEFALGLSYPTTVSVGTVLSSSGNYASATGNSSNQLIITFSNNYSNATVSGAFIHVEFFGQQGTSGAPDWDNIAFN